MNKTEIVAALLAYYIENLAKAKKTNSKRFNRFIDLKEIDCGVCNCASKIFGTNLGVWITKYKVDGAYWGPVPRYVPTRAEAIAAIQLRIDILKKEQELDLAV